MPPALRALLDKQEGHIDGFILPGHVSVIIGEEPYRFCQRIRYSYLVSLALMA